jgi:hypothetical protein
MTATGITVKIDEQQRATKLRYSIDGFIPVGRNVTVHIYDHFQDRKFTKILSAILFTNGFNRPFGEEEIERWCNENLLEVL